MPVGRWQRNLSTYPAEWMPGITESPVQDRNTHINEKTEKCRSMAAVMLFLFEKRQRNRTQYTLLYAVRASIYKELREWGTFY